MRTILATAAVVVTLAFPLQAGDTSKELGSQNPAPVGLPGGMSLSLEAMTAARHHWPVVTPDCPRTAKLPLPHEERPVDVEELRRALVEYLNNGQRGEFAWHPETPVRAAVALATLR